MSQPQQPTLYVESPLGEQRHDAAEPHPNYSELDEYAGCAEGSKEWQSYSTDILVELLDA
jgi:hypothetical protein